MVDLRRRGVDEQRDDPQPVQSLGARPRPDGLEAGAGTQRRGRPPALLLDVAVTEQPLHRATAAGRSRLSRSRAAVFFVLAGAFGLVATAVATWSSSPAAARWVRPPTCEGFEDCSRRCDDGDGDACAKAGDLVARGEYVPLDRAKASALQRRACTLGSANACDDEASAIATDQKDEARELRRRAFQLRRAACEVRREIPACLALAHDLDAGWDLDTKEGRDPDGARKLREDLLGVVAKECRDGLAQACLDAGRLSSKLAGESTEGRAAKPHYQRACSLDATKCWQLGALLGKLGDPGAAAAIDAACEASDDGSSCYDPKNHADAALLRRHTDKQRAACGRGLRSACIALAGREPDGWASVRTIEERTADHDAARSLLRRECDSGQGTSCRDLAEHLGLDVNGQLTAGASVLEIALLNERACALGETWACKDSERAPLLRDVTAVYPGLLRTCIQKRSGQIACFGTSMTGATGQPTGGALALTDIPVPSSPIDVVLSLHSTCARWADGAVRCWGRDPANRSRSSHVPFDVPDLAGAVDLRATSDADQICAALESGGARCFDGGDRQELHGVDQVFLVAYSELTRTAYTLSWTKRQGEEPARVTLRAADEALRATQFGAGSSGVCALMSDRTVACARIDLARAPATTTIDLVPVRGVSDAVELSVMDTRACARLGDGRVTCWLMPGLNATTLVGLDDATQLSGACAATKRGFAFCWGGRYGVPWGTVEALRVSWSYSEGFSTIAP